MLHHPDRPGGDTATYQTIQNAYSMLGDFIEKNYETSKDDFEEQIARSVFRQFNSSDIKENLASFTIKIENHLSLVWDRVLTKHYGIPLDRKANGKHWKHCDYTDDGSNKCDITIGKWHIPKKDKQSKLLIQSNGSGNLLASHYVCSHLPELLSEVTKVAEDTPQIQKTSSKSLQSQYKSICKTSDLKPEIISSLYTHMNYKHKAIQNKIPTPLKVLPSTPTTHFDRTPYPQKQNAQ